MKKNVGNADRLIRIIIAALLVIDPLRVLQSVLGAVAVSAILVLNHRPGRYLGV